MSSIDNKTKQRENEKCESSFTQLLKTLSQGVWLANSNRIRLEKVRGKFIHHMGYLADSVDDESKDESKSTTKVDFLYPEEALFLTENSNLIVHLNIRETQRLSMSIQQCYEVMFDARNDAEIDLDCYKIYSNLVKNGFIVRRSRANKKVSVEKTSLKQMRPSNKPTKVRPIIPKSEHKRLTQGEIYSCLSDQIVNVTVDELRERFSTDQNMTKSIQQRPRHLFDVYQADKRFQKSKPPTPEFNVFAPNQTSKLLVPDLDDFIANSVQSNAQIYAFADEANQPIYYSFDFNFSIPSIVKQ